MVNFLACQFTSSISASRALSAGDPEALGMTTSASTTVRGLEFALAVMPGASCPLLPLQQCPTLIMLMSRQLPAPPKSTNLADSHSDALGLTRPCKALEKKMMLALAATSCDASTCRHILQQYGQRNILRLACHVETGKVPSRYGESECSGEGEASCSWARVKEINLWASLCAESSTS